MGGRSCMVEGGGGWVVGWVDGFEESVGTAGGCGWAGGASVFKWAEGKDVGDGACEDAVRKEAGSMGSEPGVGECVEGEGGWLVVEHVDVGMEHSEGTVR